MLSPKIIETFNTCTIDCNVHCIKISRNTIMRIFAFAKRKFNQYVKSIKTKFTIYIYNRDVSLHCSNQIS